MNDDDINYKNNPLHGVSLKNMLTELVDQYGFEILFAYLNINSFKNNPSIISSVKFIKKTDWAREKVEAFYLYQFKNLPKVSSEQFSLSPRDRIIPEDQQPGEPAKLSFEDAELVREKIEKKSAEYNQNTRSRSGFEKGHSGNHSNNRNKNHRNESTYASESTPDKKIDPWAKWKK